MTQTPPIEGLTRAELDQKENRDFAADGVAVRPRDAATLIILDKREGDYRVLLGRRRRDLAFMAGKLVFPGGRTEPSDGQVEGMIGLSPAEEEKLKATIRGGSAVRARAIAASAVREACEEVGILMGRAEPFECCRAGWEPFAVHNVRPALDELRIVARAITPPGRVRRFDTRFFAAWRRSAAVELPPQELTGGELEDLVWLSIADAKEADIPTITRTVLGEIEGRLRVDPELSPGASVPFYHMVRNKLRRDVI